MGQARPAPRRPQAEPRSTCGGAAPAGAANGPAIRSCAVPSAARC